MPTNEFLPFASGTDPNVMTQAAYAALSARTGGFTSGTALSEQVNKVWRQAANMASALGGLIALRGLDALDDGDVDALRDALLAVIPQRGDNAVYSTPGTYSWPVPDGVTRIRCRVWGGGGGGAGATSGNAATGGHGGGYSEGFFAVTPGSTLAVIVGAGGNGGSAGNNGSTGGTSSVGSLLSATGGGGGRASGSATSAVGVGSGGQINVNGMQAANSYAAITPVIASAGAGAFGTSATAITVSGGFIGGFPAGGGGGAANNNAGAAGGGGWVIIEY